MRQQKSVPAVHGGRPVREKPLPYGHHDIDEADIQAVIDVLRSDWITTGPKIDEFEEAFAERIGARFAISFSSGTAALHGAAFAAGLEKGDEAITSPMTFCATANSVLYQGARPVFADVSPDTLNIDPGEAANRITPRTKVILPVDYAGHPADLDSILDIADKHGLKVIEDACHALGAEYRGQRIGGISHMTTFSFHPVKHITSGEGGMVTTNDPETAQRLRMFRNHGIERDDQQREAQGLWYYQMVSLGYNYRLTDIGCALALSQMRKLDDNLARRREIADRYTLELGSIAGIIPPTVKSVVSPAWHLYPIRLDLEKLKVGRSSIFDGLRAEGLGVNVHYIPVHMHPYYQNRFGYQKGQYPVAEQAYEKLITLPISHGMSNQDVEDVIECTGKVLHYCSK